MLLDMNKLVNNRDAKSNNTRKVQNIPSDRERRGAVNLRDDVQVLDVDDTSDISEILDQEQLRAQTQED